MASNRRNKNKNSATPSQKTAVFLAGLAGNKLFRFLTLAAVAYMVLIGHFFSTIIQNVSYLEIFPDEIIFPVLMHATTALFIASIIFWLPWLKTFSGKMLAGAILALFMVDYNSNFQAVSGLLRAFTPGVTDKDPLVFISIVYMTLLVVLTVAISKGTERLTGRIKRLRPRDMGLGVLVLVGYMFVLPAFSMGQILPTIIQESSVQAPQLTSKGPSAKPTEKPDIYYIVLDRYASADTLKNQFAFDNSDFTGFLKNNGFRVNDSAHSNYPYTTMSISSTMSANYTKDEIAPFKDNSIQTASLYHNLIRQSAVVKALKSEGYAYYSVGSTYGASNMAPLADRDYMWDHQVTIFGKTKTLRDIEAIEFMKSPYYSFSHLDMSWWPLRSADLGPVDYVRTQLNTLNNIATKETPGGRFVFAHILVPHEPFYFNGDGSVSTTSVADDTGKPIKQKYIGQVQFINTQIKQLIESIQKQSKGKAVIILNADEGPYPQVLNSTFLNPTGYTDPEVDYLSTKGDMRVWPEDWLKMKFGILQAVHIPKATPQALDQISSVNMFRVVLNTYFGYGLDYLPNCQLAVTHGKWYEFELSDISYKFSAKPPSSCKDYQSSPDKS